jgi:hypothetical protein
MLNIISKSRQIVLQKQRQQMNENDLILSDFPKKRQKYE